jgi:hypothetical protein
MSRSRGWIDVKGAKEESWKKNTFIYTILRENASLLIYFSRSKRWIFAVPFGSLFVIFPVFYVLSRCVYWQLSVVGGSCFFCLLLLHG